MGVGGMVGGGIFSVLGLSVGLAGHAAPIAFALGGIIAMLTGFSYARLGLVFRSDGGSFTYLEHVFHHRNIAALGGWLLLSGYIGTLSLYAYTFGVYGAAMLGSVAPAPLFLSAFVLLSFLGINLYGVRASGDTEDIIVLFKVLLLFLFAVIGLFNLKADHLLPFFNQGANGVLMGAALIFVAYEGFELIPNTVHEMRNVERNLPYSIVISIGITITIYILVSLVAVGNLLPEQISKYKEYALAVAAKPFLGQAGFLLIGLGALLSTASAINATLFGTARLGMVMAKDETLPHVFDLRERTKEIPWVSLCIITTAALLFVSFGNLTMISSFASSTFLLIFIGINLAAFRFRRKINLYWASPLLALLLSSAAWLILCFYLWRHDPTGFLWMGSAYLIVAIIELLFSERRILFRKH